MEQLSTNEEVFEMEFFIIGFIVGFILTYFMRAIIWAVSRYLIPKEA
jgi:multisubunit Na+/H+ antiporter MnhE subunit